MTQEADRARTVLPVPDPSHGEITATDAKDPEAKFPPIQPLRPPAGAPNVLMILLDDVALPPRAPLAARATTPTAERLAAGGLKFNRFHTTALCSPTRAALADRPQSPYASGMGGITEIATSAPGYNSIRPNICAPLAEILKLNGYSTAQFGKCHEVPVWETSPWVRSMPGRSAAVDSSTSTASSAARRTNGTPRFTRAQYP